MRWHPLLIRFALSIKYSSTSAYNTLGHFFMLPSMRLLRDYTHWMKFEPGMNCDVMKSLLKEMSQEGFNPHGFMVGLLLDEVKIKSGLVFSKSSGNLIGFVNLGDVNDEITEFEASCKHDISLKKASPILATHMFVVMLRAIKKPSFTFPIAQYPSANLTGSSMYPIVWDTIEALELNDIHVVSITSDGASSNRNFYVLSAEKGEIPYKVENPYRPLQYIYFFCDAPHLLKTARNCLRIHSLILEAVH